jgi:L-lysine 2,3-aminomutase
VYIFLKKLYIRGRFVMSESIQVPAEVYSRISGYFRPVFVNGKTGQWNKGKTEEFMERRKADVFRASTRNFNTRKEEVRA